MPALTATRQQTGDLLFNLSDELVALILSKTRFSIRKKLPLVCKRWQRLALDTDGPVWAKCDIDDTMPFYKMVCGLSQHGRRIRMASIDFLANSPWNVYHSGAAILMSLLPNLQHLYISCDGSFFDVAVDLKCLVLLPQLRYLRVHSGEWDTDNEWHAASLPALPQLRHLSFSMFPCDGEALLLRTAPDALQSLTCLDIRNWDPYLSNPLNMGEAVSQMHLLQEIWLAGVLSYIPSQFSHLPHLQSMFLADMQPNLSGPGEPFLQGEALWNCPCLTYLSLKDVPEYAATEWGRICRRLRCLTALQRLEIKESAVFDLVPADAWCLPSSLTSLQIWDCSLQTIPEAIASLPSLKLLEVSSNPLEHLPEGPFLDKLQLLDLSHTSIVDVPPSLAKAVHLRELALTPTGQGSQARSRKATILPLGCQLVTSLTSKALEEYLGPRPPRHAAPQAGG